MDTSPAGSQGCVPVESQVETTSSQSVWVASVFIFTETNWAPVIYFVPCDCRICFRVSELTWEGSWEERGGLACLAVIEMSSEIIREHQKVNHPPQRPSVLPSWEAPCLRAGPTLLLLKQPASVSPWARALLHPSSWATCHSAERSQGAGGPVLYYLPISISGWQTL